MVAKYVPLDQLHDVCSVSCVKLTLTSLIEQELEQPLQQIDLGLSLSRIFEVEIAEEGLEDLEELRSGLKGFLWRFLAKEVGLEGITEISEDKAGDFDTLFSMSLSELIAAY